MWYNSDFLVWLNAVGYLIITLYVFFTCKNNGAALFIATLYFISSTFGIYYYYNGFYDYSKLTFIPFLYLWIMFFILLRPLINFDRKRVYGFTVGEGVKFIWIICYFSCLISIEPFLENLLNAFRSGNDLGSVYYMRANGLYESDRLSWIGKKLNTINLWLKDLFPLLLFYLLSKYPLKKIKWLVAGLLVAVVNYWVYVYGVGQRAGLIDGIFYFICVFLLFRSSLTENIRKLAYKCVGLIAGLVFLSTMIITLSRNEGGDLTEIWTGISLYAGEGTLNFNVDMWPLKNQTDGSLTFPLLTRIADISPYSDLETRRIYVHQVTGIRAMVFYTYIEPFFLDFGKYGAFIFILFLSIGGVKLIKAREDTPLYQLVLLCVFCRIYCTGPMFYAYSIMSEQYGLFFDLLFCLILFFQYQKKKAIKWN